MTYSRITLKHGGKARTDRVDPKFYYVDPVQFYEAIKVYLINREECEAAGKDIPIIPDYIGSCFMKIAIFMSRKPNFVAYSFRDDMISDAVMNMCTYVHKFKYKEHSNPFSYFMQSCFYSFLLRIKKEKKEAICKAAVASQMGTMLDDMCLELQDTDNPDYKNTSIELMQLRSSNMLKTFEDKKAAAKKKKQGVAAKTIEELME